MNIDNMKPTIERKGIKTMNEKQRNALKERITTNLRAARQTAPITTRSTEATVERHLKRAIDGINEVYFETSKEKSPSININGVIFYTGIYFMFKDLKRKLSADIEATLLKELLNEGEGVI